jgi:thioredoxin 1
MKLGTLGLIALGGVSAFVVYAAFSPAPPPPGGAAVSVPGVAAALASGRPVLLEFSAAWCGPCRQVKPEVEALAREVSGLAEVVAIDVDEQRELAAQYKVRSIPCFVVVRNGREVARQSGAIPKAQMRQMLGL